MNDDVEFLVLLHANRVVKLAFFDEVRNLIEEIRPALERDVDYTAEMLCGPEFWKSLSATECRMAGMCVAFIVRQEMVPLVCSVCRHRYPKRYRLK